MPAATYPEPSKRRFPIGGKEPNKEEDEDEVKPPDQSSLRHMVPSDDNVAASPFDPSTLQTRPYRSVRLEGGRIPGREGTYEEQRAIEDFENKSTSALNGAKQSGLYTTDLYDDAIHFRIELELAIRTDGKVICAFVNPKSPIPVDSRIGLLEQNREEDWQQFLSNSTDSDRSQLRKTVEAMLQKMRFAIISHPISKATELFLKPFGESIDKRRKAKEAQSPEKRNHRCSADSLPIKVTTEPVGLEVCYSPAYFLTNTGTALGNGSSPVDGCLHPGRYIFGVVQGEEIKWHGIEYEVPPADEIRLKHHEGG